MNSGDGKKKNKPKPTTEIDFFAALLTNTTEDSNKQTKKKDKKQPTAAAIDQPLPTSAKLTKYNAYDGGAPKKKKRRLISTLKKKIIKERLELHKAKTPVFTDITGATISESENDAERTVVLLNFTSGMDYNAELELEVEVEAEREAALRRGFDADELEETFEDARDLLGRFGAIKKLYLARVGEQREKEQREKEKVGEEEVGEGVATATAVMPNLCVTFFATSSVLLALSALDGIVLGGQIIRVKMLKQLQMQVPEQTHVSAHTSPAGTLTPTHSLNHTGLGSEVQSSTTYPSPLLVTPEEKEQGMQEVIVSSSSSSSEKTGGGGAQGAPPPHALPITPQFTTSGVKLILENVVCRGDVQGTEELDEVLADIRYLCKAYGATLFSWRDTTMAVHLHSPPPPLPFPLPLTSIATEWPAAAAVQSSSSPQLPLTFLWHSDVQAAFTASQRCQGTIIEGRALAFSFYDYRAYERSQFSLSHCIPFPRNASMHGSSSSSRGSSDAGGDGDSRIFGVQLRGLRWGCGSGSGSGAGACSVDTMMSDMETLLLHCTQDRGDDESVSGDDGDTQRETQRQRDAHIQAQSDAHMRAKTLVQFASVKELLFCCNFYYGNPTAPDPTSSSRAVDPSSSSPSSASSSSSGIHQQNILFLGISFDECVRLQSYINQLVINMPHVRVHSERGGFKHLQLHPSDNIQDIKLRADIISTVSAHPEGASPSSSRFISPCHHFPGQNSNKCSNDETDTDTDIDTGTVAFTYNIKSTDKRHDDNNNNNNNYNNVFTRIADNRNDNDHLTLTQAPRSTVLPCRVPVPQIISKAGAGCVIVAQNYLDTQDLPGVGDSEGGGGGGSSVSVFPEEIKALKIDFLKLLNLYTRDMDAPNNKYCKRLHFVPATELAMNTSPPHLAPPPPFPAHMQQDNDKYDVAISFKNISHSIDVMLTLDEIVLGGQKVKALLSEDRCTSDNVIFSYTPGNMPATVQDSTLVAPAVSKLPAHSIPVATEVPVASDEINGVTKEMLKKLATFQLRAKESDPLNAKKKERFVMGIKQVTNTVKSGRARLILVAPNTEESAFVDAKLETLITEALRNQIPIVYSLKRRPLGKAALCGMKQVVVSITNPDGAYPEFKKIIHFLEEYKQQSK